ncbi:MAG TPA: DedA family protein [Dehalococcoidales bacterium]|nr:DedA family protein [Dehalococcoidales bacterium]
MTSLEQQIINLVQTVYLHIGWYGVTGLMAIESFLIPFPSEIIMPFAGWMLIEKNGMAATWVLFAAMWGAVGNTAGSIASYYMGKGAGRPFLNKYGKYVLLSQHDLDISDRWFARSGSWTVLAGRLLPLIRTYISIPAGIAKMNVPKFIIYTFAGSFIWSAGLAYGGYLLGDHWEELRTAMRPFDPVFIAVVVILIALYIYRHVRHVKG